MRPDRADRVVVVGRGSPPILGRSAGTKPTRGENGLVGLQGSTRPTCVGRRCSLGWP